MILIQGGTVKPISSPDIENGQVLIDGDKIVAVGHNLPVPEGTEVVDASGCLVTPGLIDAHCHIGLIGESIGWEGDDVNEIVNPLTPDMRGSDGINPMDESFRLAVEGGVTTAVTGPGSANVMGGTFCALKLHGTCVDEMIIRDPVAMKIAFGENPKSCYGQDGKAPMTRMGVAALLRSELTKAFRYAKEVDEANADASKKRPFDPQLEALLPVVHHEIPLKAHAHQADDILTALRIAREFGLDITLDHVTDGQLILPQLIAAGKPVLVGPSLGNKSKFELKNKSFATPGVLDEAGLTVCIITDAPVIPLHYLPLCAGLAVKDGMKEESAWRAITLNPAKVAGVDGRVGSLEPGKDADIVLFDGNPLRDIQATTRKVFINGKAM